MRDAGFASPLAAATGAGTDHARIGILDGWRALSILLVIAGHLLPLGLPAWQMNAAAAATGMVIFFNLSGFLIARMLLADPDVPSFLARRIFRIVPLAWAAMLVLAIANGADLATIIANFGFYSNLPPTQLFYGGEHLWSLCVEVQFYLGIALLLAAAGRRGLYLLPLLALAITAIRIAQGATISIFTWQRVDEILAGCIVAILMHHGVLERVAARLPAVTPILLMPLVIASAHPEGGWLAYARPYLSAAAVGLSIYAAPPVMDRLFRSRPAVYVATISYALYVFHAMLNHTWLGEGERFVRWAKLPLLIGATFLLAHLSTFHFEARMIAVGKRVARRVRGRQASVPDRAAP